MIKLYKKDSFVSILDNDLSGFYDIHRYGHWFRVDPLNDDRVFIYEKSNYDNIKYILDWTNTQISIPVTTRQKDVNYFSATTINITSREQLLNELEILFRDEDKLKVYENFNTFPQASGRTNDFIIAKSLIPGKSGGIYRSDGNNWLLVTKNQEGLGLIQNDFVENSTITSVSPGGFIQVDPSNILNKVTIVEDGLQIFSLFTAKLDANAGNTIIEMRLRYDGGATLTQYFSQPYSIRVANNADELYVNQFVTPPLSADTYTVTVECDVVSGPSIDVGPTQLHSTLLATKGEKGDPGDPIGIVSFYTDLPNPAVNINVPYLVNFQQGEFPPGVYNTTDGIFWKLKTGNQTNTTVADANMIGDTPNSAILSGSGNTITTLTGTTGGAVIVSGIGNLINTALEPPDNLISAQTILNGLNNLVSGSTSTFSTITNGKENFISGKYGTILSGIGARITNYGETVIGSDKIYVNGDNQYGFFGYVASTTGSTIQEIYLKNGVERFILEPNTSYRISLTVNSTCIGAGGGASVGDMKGWNAIGGIKNIAGTVSLETTITPTVDYSAVSLTTAALSITADNTNKSLKVEVTGIITAILNWNVVVKYEKIGW